jgi:hypothetical protein
MRYDEKSYHAILAEQLKKGYARGQARPARRVRNAAAVGGTSMGEFIE